MNSRERFYAACSHTASDCIPIDYLAHPCMDIQLRQFSRAGSKKDPLDSVLTLKDMRAHAWPSPENFMVSSLLSNSEAMYQEARRDIQLGVT